jgi:hypothetical protein
VEAPQDPQLEAQLQACAAVGNYLVGVNQIADTQVQQLVVGTLDRSLGTLSSITLLIPAGNIVQAAMLCRPLFEDMAVMHWLVLNEDDPDFLIERFLDHLDAMLLLELDTFERLGWDQPVELPEEITARRGELRNRFGRYAQKDWWAVRSNGSPLSMPDLLDEIAAAERFHPRLSGEAPILHQYYDYVHKWTTQCLHHTAAGLPVRLNRAGDPPQALRQPLPVRVLSAAFWVYSQLVFLALDVQGWRQEEFDELFRSQLVSAFVANLEGEDDQE